MEMNPEAWNKSTIELPDGGRIMAVPGSEQTIRGVPALDLLIIDEASRVTDELMVAVRPMIATTGGTIMALSTPAGQKGWFFEAAEGGSPRQVGVLEDHRGYVSADWPGPSGR